MQLLGSPKETFVELTERPCRTAAPRRRIMDGCRERRELTGLRAQSPGLTGHVRDTLSFAEGAVVLDRSVDPQVGHTERSQYVILRQLAQVDPDGCSSGLVEQVPRHERRIRGRARTESLGSAQEGCPSGLIVDECPPRRSLEYRQAGLMAEDLTYGRRLDVGRGLREQLRAKWSIEVEDPAGDQLGDGEGDDRFRGAIQRKHR